MRTDQEKTKSYYASDALTDQLCDCEDCRRYYKKVRAAYPELAAWLEALGADIEKPFELGLPIGPDETGKMEYTSCMYVLLGACEPGFACGVGDMKIVETRHHPTVHVDTPHFVLDAGPIFLDEN